MAKAQLDIDQLQIQIWLAYWLYNDKTFSLKLALLMDTCSSSERRLQIKLIEAFKAISSYDTDHLLLTLLYYSKASSGNCNDRQKFQTKHLFEKKTFFLLKRNFKNNKNLNGRCFQVRNLLWFWVSIETWTKGKGWLKMTEAERTYETDSKLHREVPKSREKEKRTWFVWTLISFWRKDESKH